MSDRYPSFRGHTFRAMAVALFCIATTSAPATAQEVVFASWGGAFQDALRSSMLEPAAEALDITINEDTTNGIQDVRAQISANAVVWDITEQALDVCVQLKNEGALEALDYTVISTDGIPGGLVDTHWIGLLNYSLVIGWRSDKFGDSGPKSWAEFWDIERFPGKRAMFGKVNHNLEAALMADGVAHSEVNAVLQSPGGMERAFEKLAEIAPHVSVWYRGGSQAAQLLRDGEVDLIHIGNGRAESIIADGAPVAYTWNQATLDADCVLVPKEAPNRELAMKVINEMVSAESQARMAAAISYGPVNVTAFETGIVPADQAAKNNSAPENLVTQVILDPNFYVENAQILQEQFDILVQQ